MAIYLDALPSPKNCVKVNAAISDRDGHTEVWYIHPEDLIRHDLPDWLRGCNSIGAPHPTAEYVLRERNATQLLRQVKVPVFRLSSVLTMYDVSGIFHLKVDTEGHDCIILNALFDDVEPTLFPFEVRFESNVLSRIRDVQRLIARMIMLGYDLIEARTDGGASDTFLRRNVNETKQRKGFAPTGAGYYLAGYPPGYDFMHPPHENSLSGAQQFCAENGFGGVTYQYDRFEVRLGDYLFRDAGNQLIRSWVAI